VRPATTYVVEDDAAVRDSLRVLLECEGFTVVAFASAEAFLSETQPDGSGCLLLDVHLPGMSGHELLEALRRDEIEIAVMLMSGDPDRAMRHAAERHGALLLEKPVAAEELLHAVRDALRGGWVWARG
jgi:FixJ family two-component response regulator